MNLLDYVRKEVEIEFIDGNRITGFVTSFDEKDELDNIMFDSITLEDTGLYEFVSVYENEIKSIKIVGEE